MLSMTTAPRCPTGPRRRTRNLVKSVVTFMALACASTSTSLSSSAGAARTEVLALSHHSSTPPSLTTPPRPTTQRCDQARAPLPRRRMGVLPTFALTCLLPLPWPSRRAINPTSSPTRAVTVAMEATHTTHPEVSGWASCD